MRSLKTLLLVAGVALAGGALAHDDAGIDRQPGSHGGQQRVAGDYHVELVVPPLGHAGPDSVLTVYLADHDDRPMATAGATGRAAVVANRQRINVALEPAGDNVLRGSGRFVPEPDLVVVVSFGRPGEATQQARFTPFKYLDGSPRTPGGAEKTSE